MERSNKIYLGAQKVEVGLKLKRSENRAEIKKVEVVELKNEIDNSKFDNYKNYLLSRYYSNNLVSKKQSFQRIVSILSKLDNFNTSDRVTLKELNFEDLKFTANNRLLTIFRNNRLKILKIISNNFISISKEDQTLLVNTIDNRLNPKKDVVPINDIDVDEYVEFLHKKTSKYASPKKDTKFNSNNGLSPLNMRIDSSEKVSNFNSSGHVSQSRIMNKTMFDKLNPISDNTAEMIAGQELALEFQRYIGLEIPLWECYEYVKNDMNLKIAAEKYFLKMYGTRGLNIYFIFPGNVKYFASFKFTDRPDKIFDKIVELKPEIIAEGDINLYIDNTKYFKYEPKVKFIGTLKLKQNTCFYIQISKYQ